MDDEQGEKRLSKEERKRILAQLAEEDRRNEELGSKPSQERKIDRVSEDKGDNVGSDKSSKDAERLLDERQRNNLAREKRRAERQQELKTAEDNDDKDIDNIPKQSSPHKQSDKFHVKSSYSSDGENVTEPERTSIIKTKTKKNKKKKKPRTPWNHLETTTKVVMILN